MGIITEDEQVKLRVKGLSFDVVELMQTTEYVNIFNALVQGLDVLPKHANNFIHLVSSIELDFSGAFVRRLLEDLGTIDATIEKLYDTGKLSESEYNAIRAKAIGIERVVAVSDAQTPVRRSDPS